MSKTSGYCSLGQQERKSSYNLKYVSFIICPSVLDVCYIFEAARQNQITIWLNTDMVCCFSV